MNRDLARFRTLQSRARDAGGQLPENELFEYLRLNALFGNLVPEPPAGNNIDAFLRLRDRMQRGEAGGSQDNARLRRMQMRLHAEHREMMQRTDPRGAFRGSDNEAIRLARLQNLRLPTVVELSDNDENVPVRARRPMVGNAQRTPNAQGDPKRRRLSMTTPDDILRRLRSAKEQGYPPDRKNSAYAEQERELRVSANDQVIEYKAQGRPGMTPQRFLLRLAYGGRPYVPGNVDRARLHGVPLCREMAAEGMRTTYGPLPLQDHQIKAVCMIMKREVRGLLLYYGMGTGKTLTSIACMDHLSRQAIADGRRFKRIIVMVPASLRDNYQDDMSRADIGQILPRPQIVTHNALAKLSKHQVFDLASDALVIVDEAHVMRNEFAKGLEAEKENKTARFLALASRVARKALLLTGTPVFNWPRDIAPLINAVKPNSVKVEPDEFDQVFGREGNRNRDILAAAMRCAVLYYGASDPADMPKVTTGDVIHAMTPAQVDAHKRACDESEKRLAEMEPDDEISGSFMVRHRQACNAVLFDERYELVDFKSGAPDRRIPETWRVESGKIQDIARMAVDAYYSDEQQPRKVMIYSHFTRYGIRAVQYFLERVGLAEGKDFVVVTGNTDDKTRLIGRYNDDNDTVRMLLMTGAVAQGVSLKGTDDVHIVEPDFNVSIIEQVIARAARIKSHESRVRQSVRVYRHYSNLPTSGSAPDLNRMGADLYLKELCSRKQVARDNFLSFVKDVARRNEREC